MHPIFIHEDDCPTNRDRLDAYYRKRLPFLTKRSNTWSYLRIRGEAIKRQWRAYWAMRAAANASNVVSFSTKKPRNPHF